MLNENDGNGTGEDIRNGKRMKKCSRCVEEKHVSEFSKNCTQRDGLNNWCKKCVRETGLIYRERPDVKSRMRAASRRSYLKHKDIINKRAMDWKKNNIERAREVGRINKRKSLLNPKNKICNSIRAEMYACLHGNKGGRKWESLVGYSAYELMEYLELLFARGMSWDNYGSGWHIDHIIPISAFNFEKHTDIDFARCWSLENLRPLWKTDNLRKGAKLDREFQPCLMLG